MVKSGVTELQTQAGLFSPIDILSSWRRSLGTLLAGSLAILRHNWIVLFLSVQSQAVLHALVTLGWDGVFRLLILDVARRNR
ncbi:hypothetical protein BC834DRAFT_312127 [Gloeopeniophorella convolvens]|nr:hypothetical protein BC834DRAFT_312127 [Gloeopeniophorella convolvens]